MEIFIYILSFILGAFIGSFASLAIYRIPIGDNIVYKHSYCPNCNHKLKIKDLIPLFSYIFLKGKCRYCNKKVRIRYLFLELSCGLLLLLFAMSFNINFTIIELDKIIFFVLGVLYIIGLIIIAGIDKEKFTIQKSLLIYEIIVLLLYIIYLYVLRTDIYRYVIYLFLVLIFTIIDTILLRKKGKTNYTLQILILCMIITSYTGPQSYLLSVIFTLVAIALKLIINRKEKQINVPIGYYLCVSNLVVMICQNFLMYS